MSMSSRLPSMAKHPRQNLIPIGSRRFGAAERNDATPRGRRPLPPIISVLENSRSAIGETEVLPAPPLMRGCGRQEMDHQNTRHDQADAEQREGIEPLP